jgi:hypothetical protein
MRATVFVGATLGLALTAAAGAALAQTTPATVALPPGTAAHSPGFKYDKMSWETFVAVVKPAPDHPDLLTFETWATDQDTFTENPVWPSGPLLGSARPGRFQTSALQISHMPVGFVAATAPVIAGNCAAPGSPAAANFPTPATADPPANCIAEEVRRNRSSFSYIVSHGLNLQAGILNAIPGPVIQFPTDAVELKMDWIPVATLKTWLNSNGVATPAGFVEGNYYVTNSGGTQYALLSMHISTKQLPEWLWATFENQYNPGRCDTMGCYDEFGTTAALSTILPHQTPPPGGTQNQYPACAKSTDLAQLFSAAGLGTMWNSYCLKASQIDYLSTQDATMGKALLNGDSVIERLVASVPIQNSSCITCHAYAGTKANGCVDLSGNPGLQPAGPTGLVNWPYMATQKSYDFVWGVINVNFMRSSVCP